MGFYEKFVKKELNKGTTTHEIGSLGIRDNLCDQWIKRYKGMGIISTDRYLFGYADDYAYDHIYIIDTLQSHIDNPTIMFGVHGETDRVLVNINPMHTSSATGITSEFEYSILRNMLIECKEAYKTIPGDINLIVDIDTIFLDVSDPKIARAKNSEEIEKMVAHLAKPRKASTVSPHREVTDSRYCGIFDKIKQLIRTILSK